MVQDWMSKERNRDLRTYARSTQLRLALGGILVILVVGEALIWWRYGWAAARAALLCTGVALTPVAIILVWLQLLSWLSRKGRGD
jgi:hypothetical protein